MIFFFVFCASDRSRKGAVEFATVPETWLRGNNMLLWPNEKGVAEQLTLARIEKSKPAASWLQIVCDIKRRNI